MAVRNFAFRQNWAGRKVAGMKRNFVSLPFFTQTGPTFWPQKAQTRSSLKVTYATK